MILIQIWVCLFFDILWCVFEVVRIRTTEQLQLCHYRKPPIYESQISIQHKDGPQAEAFPIFWEHSAGLWMVDTRSGCGVHLRHLLRNVVRISYINPSNFTLINSLVLALKHQLRALKLKTALHLPNDTFNLS